MYSDKTRFDVYQGLSPEKLRAMKDALMDPLDMLDIYGFPKNTFKCPKCGKKTNIEDSHIEKIPDSCELVNVERNSATLFTPASLTKTYRKSYYRIYICRRCHRKELLSNFVLNVITYLIIPGLYVLYHIVYKGEWVGIGSIFKLVLWYGAFFVLNMILRALSTLTVLGRIDSKKAIKQGANARFDFEKREDPSFIWRLLEYLGK